MLRVLITGGAGFVGSHLRKYLKMRDGAEVVSLDFRKEPEVDLVVDLTRKDEVSKVVTDGVLGQNIDVIVHLAARLIGSDNPHDISVLHDNITMTENVAYLAERLSVRAIVHASTMAVYPNETGSYSETSVPITSRNAECLYGLSKICSEQLLDFFMLNHLTRVVHLRFAQIYGEGMRNDRVMSHMEQELEATNCITVYGDGERVSNFISVDGVINSISRFIKNDAVGVFNIGGEQLSYRQLAQRIIDQKGNSSSSIASISQGSREQVVLDCSKYQALLKSEEESV